jgi:hypothetical protein
MGRDGKLTLGYGRRKQRAEHPRWITAGALFAGGLLVAWHFRGWILAYARTSFYARRCTDVVTVPGTVAYQGDPTAAAELVSGGGYFKWHDYSADGTQYVALREPPPNWSRLLDALDVERGIQLGPGSEGNAGVCTLTHGAGRRYIVGVDVLGAPLPGGGLILTVNIVQLRALGLPTVSEAQFVWTWRKQDLASVACATEYATIYCGTVDPSNPARFLIPFSSGPVAGQIVGTLNRRSGDVSLGVEPLSGLPPSVCSYAPLPRLRH